MILGVGHACKKLVGEISRVPFVKFNKYRLNICLWFLVCIVEKNISTVIFIFYAKYVDLEYVQSAFQSIMESMVKDLNAVNADMAGWENRKINKIGYFFFIHWHPLLSPIKITSAPLVFFIHKSTSVSILDSGAITAEEYYLKKLNKNFKFVETGIVIKWTE